MNIIGYVFVGIVAVLVGYAAATIYYSIIKSIKSQVDFDNKYKSSFSKYFHNLKVPVIKLKIGGELRYFLVDSGAETNILDKNILEKLPKKCYTKLADTSDITSVIPIDPVETSKISAELTYKNEVYSDVEFDIVDLTNVINLVKSKSKIQVVGILGSEFFSKYKWLIDFNNRCLWISQSKANE